MPSLRRSRVPEHQHRRHGSATRASVHHRSTMDLPQVLLDASVEERRLGSAWQEVQADATVGSALRLCCAHFRVQTLQDRHLSDGEKRERNEEPPY
jgi:hypothetical protein